MGITDEDGSVSDLRVNGDAAAEYDGEIQERDVRGILRSFRFFPEWTSLSMRVLFIWLKSVKKLTSMFSVVLFSLYFFNIIS